jgi:trans-aconitate 2-methyltransferase
MWNPALYRAFAGERERPFYDLLARVGAEDPAFVVDLGCGSGELTASLARRWPKAEIHGIDSSAEMIEAAGKLLLGSGRTAAGPTGPATPTQPTTPTLAARPTQPTGEAAGDQAAEPGTPTQPTRPAEAATPTQPTGKPAAELAARPTQPTGEPAAELAAEPGQEPGQEPGSLRFELGDVRDWQPDRPADVLVSNAVLQWVPGHEKLLSRWAESLAAGGWLAFQLPGNASQPAYAVLRELIGSARWRPALADVDLNQQSADPAGYLDLLAGAGCEVDAWETTYLHVLHGDDPVLRWYASTGLRPVLAALAAAEAERFLTEYGALLREAYPAAPYGTAFPFRRVFVVARRR